MTSYLVVDKLEVINKENGIQACFEEYVDKYLDGEYGISVLDALRKAITISIICSSLLVDSFNECTLVKSLINLLDVVYSRHHDDELVYIIIQWFSYIAHESSSTEWHRVITPCILHYLDIYVKSPLSSHFLQLLLSIITQISSEERDLFDTTYFIPLILKLLLNSTSSSFQTIFSLLDIWASWNLPVVSQLSTEEMGRNLVIVIKTVQWNAGYLKQFLHLITVLYGSGKIIYKF